MLSQSSSVTVHLNLRSLGVTPKTNNIETHFCVDWASRSETPEFTASVTERVVICGVSRPSHKCFHAGHDQLTCLRVQASWLEAIPEFCFWSGGRRGHSRLKLERGAFFPPLLSREMRFIRLLPLVNNTGGRHWSGRRTYAHHLLLLGCRVSIDCLILRQTLRPSCSPHTGDYIGSSRQRNILGAHCVLVLRLPGDGIPLPTGAVP